MLDAIPAVCPSSGDSSPDYSNLDIGKSFLEFNEEQKSKNPTTDFFGLQSGPSQPPVMIVPIWDCPSDIDRCAVCSPGAVLVRSIVYSVRDLNESYFPMSSLSLIC